MKTEVLYISKVNVLEMVKSHSNYITERSTSDIDYERVRLFDEKYEALGEAWNESAGIIKATCRLYAKAVDLGDDGLTITMEIPTSHNESLRSGMEKEAEAVCVHNILASWYAMVLPTEVEAQRTLVEHHRQILWDMLDDREAPKREIKEYTGDNAEIIW